METIDIRKNIFILLSLSFRSPVRLKRTLPSLKEQLHYKSKQGMISFLLFFIIIIIIVIISSCLLLHYSSEASDSFFENNYIVSLQFCVAFLS